MQFNLFSWVREGVRRSVVMGVADAIDQIGTPPNSKELQTNLQHFLKDLDTPLETVGHKSPTGGRKRLGRSLKELEN